MHDPRLGSALRQLRYLVQNVPSRRWWWAIVGVEPIGRITLPREARKALAPPIAGADPIRGRCRSSAWLLARGATGAVAVPDGRGRLYLPVWLRTQALEAGSILVGVRWQPPLVVVAPIAVLEGVGDLLVGAS